MNTLKVNSLVSRMLAAGGNNNNVNSSGPSSSLATSVGLSRSEDNAPLTESSPNLNNFNSTRRNLFGIRLNHDQLKQDLKEMWKEQIERQKREWNFDFEKLKPISSSSSHSSSSNNLRFEWNKVNTKTSQVVSSSLPGSIVLSTFDQDEIEQRGVRRRVISGERRRTNYSDHEEDEQDSEEEEEDDEALAIPTFYKYQRRQKLNEEQNRLKFMFTFSSPRMTKSNASSSSVIIPSSAIKKNVKKVFKTAKKGPNLVPSNKSKIKVLKNVQHQTPGTSGESKNLIITFSENRKDTLRSAVSSATPKSNTISAFLQKSVKKSQHESEPSQCASVMVKPTAKASSSSSLNTLSVSSSSSNMKQQSLLDMLKQRKRKNSAQSTMKSTESSISNALPLVHNLRPRTTSIN